MKLRVLALAFALAALPAGGALAEGPPHPPGPPRPPGPPQGQEDGQGDHGQRPQAQPGEQAFRAELAKLGYTCAPRPVLLHGPLGAVAVGSITLHAMRANAPGRPAKATDLQVKLIASTQVHRLGPAKASDLVVGDLAMVAAVACRTATAVAGTPPTIVARIVDARPAKRS